MTNKGFVYILQSEGDGSLYLGSTSDIERRFIQHNSGAVISTKKKLPWKIVHVCRFSTAQKARKIENILKRQKRKLSLAWILPLLEELIS